ncbi:hypothetical protein M5E87_29370 [Flavonifractor plautii]|nr:hypothetical protein M5E87_29370 [Flavonifractor plautii]
MQVNLFNATLNSNTWAAIRAASDADEGANYWSVGDTKSITINGQVGNFTFSNLSISPFILGFNHNSSKEGRTGSTGSSARSAGRWWAFAITNITVA